MALVGRPSSPERAIDIPVVVLAAVAILLAIHAGRLLLSEESDLRLLLGLAFIPAPWSIALGQASLQEVLRAAAASASGSPETASLQIELANYVAQAGVKPWSWLSYSLLHGSWTHIGLNAVWLVAFGSPVARRAGTARWLLLAIATSAGGAAAQWLADPVSAQPVIGASAVLSGFMAAAATFIFDREQGEARLSRWGFLRSRGALVFLAIWLASNLLFGVVATPLGIAEGTIAWQAHIGGLVTGLVVFPLIDPGPSPWACAPHGLRQDDETPPEEG